MGLRMAAFGRRCSAIKKPPFQKTLEQRHITMELNSYSRLAFGVFDIIMKNFIEINFDNSMVDKD